jgi:Membrane protein involved in the export of O-antigen and teichoic acid
LKHPYDRKRARRSIFDTVLFRAISQAATVLSYVVLVRGLSEHEFGVFNLFYSFISLIATVLSLGLEQTLRRYQPEYIRAGAAPAALRLVRFVARGRLAANLLMLAVVLLAWNAIAPHFEITAYRAQFALFGLVLVLHFQARVLQLSLSSHMLQRYSVGMLSLLSVAKLIGYSAFVLLGSLTLETAIVVDIVGYAITFAGLRLAHRRHCEQVDDTGFRFSREERRRLLKYGLVYNFNDAGGMMLSTRADNFFVAALMNPVAVGAYSFYTRLSNMVAHLLPTQMFENIIQPLFFAIPQQEADRRVPRYFSALIDASLLVQMPALAYAAAYHREIVDLVFGGKFIEHSILLPVVFAFATLNVIATPVTLVAQYAEKAAVILLSRILGLYNLAALLILIPVLGVLGAAIANGSAHFLKNLFIWWHVRHAARWQGASRVVVSSAAIWGAYVAVALVLKRALPAHPLLHLLAGVALAAVTMLVYVRSPALSKSDRELFGSVLHGREARVLRWLGVLPAA